MKTIIDQFEKLVPAFRDLLQAPTLELHLAPTWGSVNKESRILLRHAVASEIDKLTKLTEIEREILLRLEFVPQPPLVSVSISHTQTVGGFALTRSQTPAVGFDIELSSRIRPKAVERVSSPEELSSAPSASHLWVAKEAAFKSMRGAKQPAILSMLATNSWRSVTSYENLSLWSCQIHEDSLPKASTRGLAVELSGIVLSIFLHQA